MSLRKSALCVLTALALGALGLASAPGAGLCQRRAGEALRRPAARRARPEGDPDHRAGRAGRHLHEDRAGPSSPDRTSTPLTWLSRPTAHAAEEVAAQAGGRRLRARDRRGLRPRPRRPGKRAPRIPGPHRLLRHAGRRPTPCAPSLPRRDTRACAPSTPARTAAETTGPWVVHVLEVDPDRYAGTLEPELATGDRARAGASDRHLRPHGRPGRHKRRVLRDRGGRRHAGRPRRHLRARRRPRQRGRRRPHEPRPPRRRRRGRRRRRPLRHLLRHLIRWRERASWTARTASPA